MNTQTPPTQPLTPYQARAISTAATLRHLSASWRDQAYQEDLAGRPQSAKLAREMSGDFAYLAGRLDPAD